MFRLRMMAGSSLLGISANSLTTRVCGRVTFYGTSDVRQERAQVCVGVQQCVLVCVCENVYYILECFSVCTCVSIAEPAARAQMFLSWLVCVLYTSTVEPL